MTLSAMATTHTYLALQAYLDGRLVAAEWHYKRLEAIRQALEAREQRERQEAN